jgi:LPXTG-motif cell wall-anchored protein
MQRRVIRMTFRRRLGVLATAVSGLLVAGLLLSAPALAWDTKIQDLQAECPPGSEQPQVSFTLELFESGHTGHVDAFYTVGDSKEANDIPSQEFGKDDKSIEFSFSVPNPDQDTTITVYTKTSFDDSQEQPTSKATADLATCEAQGTTTTTEAPTSTEAPTTTVLPSTAPPSTAPPTTEALGKAATTVGASKLPRTGANSMPLLIAALVLVIGGGGLLFASRVRARHAK